MASRLDASLYSSSGSSLDTVSHLKSSYNVAECYCGQSIKSKKIQLTNIAIPVVDVTAVVALNDGTKRRLPTKFCIHDLFSHARCIGIGKHFSGLFEGAPLLFLTPRENQEERID